MAYLTFDPSNEELEELLKSRENEIVTALRGLTNLGVAGNDIIPKFLNCQSRSPVPHVEIVLKTDNPKVTSPEIVKLLNTVLDIPFEVTRIPVGYGVIEFAYEVWAFIIRTRRNWASNYE